MFLPKHRPSSSGASPEYTAAAQEDNSAAINPNVLDSLIIHAATSAATIFLISSEDPRSASSLDL
jgi:hypothetical protein